MPTILIQRFGLKKTISFSILGYVLLGVFSFIPRYYTLVPCGFITGLSAATLWTSHGMYTSQIANELAEIEEQNLKYIFQGMFFLQANFIEFLIRPSIANLL